MSIANHDIDIALQKILQRTLEQTVKACSPDSTWSIQSAGSLDDIQHDHCIVLTISSFKFRVMCLLHLTMNQSTRDFVAQASGTKTEELDKSALLDYLLEMSNSMSGNLKRNLQDFCPPMGMSTPNLLERSCLHFDDFVTFAHGAHAAAMHSYQSESTFAASILVSIKQEQDFDLKNYNDYDYAEDTDSGGELELF